MVQRVFAWDEQQVSPGASSGVVTGASLCTSDIGVGVAVAAAGEAIASAAAAALVIMCQTRSVLP
jgi:hypothetical protein